MGFVVSRFGYIVLCLWVWGYLWVWVMGYRALRPPLRQSQCSHPRGQAGSGR